MSYFATTVLREAERMSALRDSYEKQLAVLPKGSLRIKERNGRKYFYLIYRNDKKVVSDYIGTSETSISELKEQLKRRKDIEKLLKAIQKELAMMSRVLRTVA